MKNYKGKEILQIRLYLKHSCIIAVFSLLYLVTSCAPGYGNKKRWMFNDSNRTRITMTARRYLGVKYRYGGTNPFGFDCSGFVMYVYMKNGIRIPRGAEGQFSRGKRISLRRAEPGDLVFFRTGRRRISHVGIYLGNYRFIHSPRTGRRVSITSIKNSYWRKRFLGAVTLFYRSRYQRQYSRRSFIDRRGQRIY